MMTVVGPRHFCICGLLPLGYSVLHPKSNFVLPLLFFFPSFVMSSYYFHNFRKGEKKREEGQEEGAVVSHGAAIMTEGLPAMGSVAAEAPCAVARAGTCPDPSTGSEKSQGRSEEVVPWLGLGHADVWGSTGPGPQKQTPDEMRLCVRTSRRPCP